MKKRQGERGEAVRLRHSALVVSERDGLRLVLNSLETREKRWNVDAGSFLETQLLLSVVFKESRGSDIVMIVLD